MNSHPNSILSLAAVLAASVIAAPVLFAQTGANTPAANSSSPVAFVYVLSNFSGSTNQLLPFATDPGGRLSAVPHSPVKANLTNMAVNGKYLFGAKNSESSVNGFTIAADGSLKYTRTTSIGGSCGAPGPVILDHTGSDLYVSVSTGGDCSSSAYLSYSGANSGVLKYIGTTAAADFFNTPLSFIGNNTYAYGSDCVNFQGNYLDTFAGYKRQSNGALTNASVTAPTPSTGNSETFYCRSYTAADPANHLAVSMQKINNSTSSPVGSPQLGTYTAGTNGNLTTTSTAKNMPTTAVGTVSVLAMSPSGKLLAVGGTGGVQVFHFNGASPITSFTGLLTKDAINQVNPSNSLLFWDHANHLYALSTATGKLYVFSVTPTKWSQSPGSPYTITKPQTLIVQSLTK